jgi:acyl-CoA synthetase (AMP-forming)/AMP-acid ligase II
MPREAIYEAAPNDPALLTFTSGSTGQPKAMVRSHAFLLAQHRVLERNFSSQPGGVSLTTLPIFVLADLASGMTSLIAAGDLRHPGRIEAAPVLAQIARYRPVRASASPAFWERIVAYCRARGCGLPHVSAVYAGGAPVFPRLLDELREIAPRAEVIAVYGSTEAEPIAHIARSAFTPEDAPAMLAGRGLLVGTPVAEIALRILRDSWGAPIGPYTAAEFAGRCLPAGEPGEIVVSGAHVSGAYLDGQGDEETKFSVDAALWHRTGDAGYLDASGRLWLLGRCAARIADERGALYPFAVEAALSAHPDVLRSAAVAIGGRRVLALELEGLADNATQQKLASTVAWAQFDEVRALRQIPVDKRHNAKIDYPALYRLLGPSRGVS